MSDANANLNAIRVSNQAMPETAVIKTMPILAVLSGATEYVVDAQQALVQKKIDRIQSVFIDNADNPETVTLLCNITNMRVVIPPNSQAWMPILVTENPVFTFRSTGNIDVPFFFCNVPMPAHVWSVSGGGGGGNAFALEGGSGLIGTEDGGSIQLEA